MPAPHQAGLLMVLGLVGTLVQSRRAVLPLPEEGQQTSSMLLKTPFGNQLYRSELLKSNRVVSLAKNDGGGGRGPEHGGTGSSRREAGFHIASADEQDWH